MHKRVRDVALLQQLRLHAMITECTTLFQAAHIMHVSRYTQTHTLKKKTTCVGGGFSERVA